MRRGTKWLLVVGVFLVLFAFVAVLATLQVGAGPRVPGHAVLWIKLGPEITEEDRRSPVEKALGRRTLTVRDHVRMLRDAAADRRVRVVVVEPQLFGGGWATAQEMRDAMEGFRKSGKPLVAFLEYGANLDYFLAAAADRVVMIPSGVLLVTGLLADVPFYKATLDKIGIQADLEHIGAYKSASDLYTRESMSEAQREATNGILDGLYGTFLQGVARLRSLSEAKVAAAVDEGFLSAPRAKELGLVDDLLYEDEVLDDLSKKLGAKPQRVKAGTYFESLREPRSGERIGLVYVTGVIVPGQSMNDPLAGALAGSETVADALRKVREDSSIKAVVLRVDSPGGSALASDVIWREVALTRQEKPVVVSMGDVAASGGYYVSMGADAIVAQPNTLTGSIGVIGGKWCMRGLYDWAALRREQIKRGANADLWTDYQRFTDGQRALIRTELMSFYREFVHKAAQGRRRTDEEIDAVAQGRVWTGGQAKEKNLVDELGGLDRAVELAREKAGIPAGRAVRLDVFPKPKGVLESMFSWGPEEAVTRRIADRVLPASARTTLARWCMEERLEAEPYLFFEESLLRAR